MDSIDITDADFSLDSSNAVGTSNMNMNMLRGSNSDYTTFIYIGIVAILIFIGLFIFKMYQNKKTNQCNKDSMDCPGGFCVRGQ
jgi:hypothetical protein